jgi:hypothetical protein
VEEPELDGAALGRSWIPDDSCRMHRAMEGEQSGISVRRIRVFVKQSKQGRRVGGVGETSRRRPNGLPAGAWYLEPGASCRIRAAGSGEGGMRPVAAGGIAGERDWRRRGWGSAVTEEIDGNLLREGRRSNRHERARWGRENEGKKRKPAGARPGWVREARQVTVGWLEYGIVIDSNS